MRAPNVNAISLTNARNRDLGVTFTDSRKVPVSIESPAPISEMPVFYLSFSDKQTVNVCLYLYNLKIPSLIQDTVHMVRPCVLGKGLSSGIRAQLFPP